MSNGSAAVALAFPPPAPTKSPADAPAASQEIGEAVAAAAVAISQAIDGYRSSGVLAHDAKAAIASRVASVALSQLDCTSDDADFVASARDAGKRVLRQYLIAGHDPAKADAAIAFSIDAVFEIVAWVVRAERACRAAAS